MMGLFRPKLTTLIVSAAIVDIFVSAATLATGSILTVLTIQTAPNSTPGSGRLTNPSTLAVLGIMYGILAQLFLTIVAWRTWLFGTIGFKIFVLEIIFAVGALVLSILSGTFWTSHGGCDGVHSWMGWPENDSKKGGVCKVWKLNLSMVILLTAGWTVCVVVHFFVIRSAKKAKQLAEEQEQDQSISEVGPALTQQQWEYTQNQNQNQNPNQQYGPVGGMEKYH